MPQRCLGAVFPHRRSNGAAPSNSVDPNPPIHNATFGRGKREARMAVGADAGQPPGVPRLLLPHRSPSSLCAVGRGHPVQPAAFFPTQTRSPRIVKRGSWPPKARLRGSSSETLSCRGHGTPPLPPAYPPPALPTGNRTPGPTACTISTATPARGVGQKKTLISRHPMRRETVMGRALRTVQTHPLNAL